MANNVIYSWSFENKKNRSILWYIVVLSIIIGLVIWGFLTKQYGMSFIILLVTGITYFIENNSEDNVNINIEELGIKIGNSFYNYSKINSYSYIYDGENAIFLRLNLNKKGISFINLNINNNIVKNLKEILSQFVEENPKGELSFSEKIINFLKL